MGRLTIRTVGELDGGLVLAPERYDTRRTLPCRGKPVSHYVDITRENTRGNIAPETRVMVLDTTHAYEGFVIFRHGMIAADAVGGHKRLLKPGDVIISRLRPYLRQVAYVHPDLFQRCPDGNLVLASTEFYVLRGRNDFQAHALVPFLLSDPVQAALSAAQEGGHHPRFSLNALGSLPVPDALVRDQSNIADAVADAASRALGSLSTIASLAESAGKHVTK